MERPSKYFANNTRKKINVKYESDTEYIQNQDFSQNRKGSNPKREKKITIDKNKFVKADENKNTQVEVISIDKGKAKNMKRIGNVIKGEIKKENENTDNQKTLFHKTLIKKGKTEIVNKKMDALEETYLKKKNFVLLTYEKIKEMRKNISAPVDVYGCDKLTEETKDVNIFRFQILMSCFLSSRTKDEVTAAVMSRLKKHGLTVENMLKLSKEEIKKLIYGIGFYNVKAQQIIQICSILKNKYNGNVPSNYEELIQLPGIGEKIAQLILQTAFKKNEGIAVDTHLHRIANRLQWVNTKNEMQTQIQLKNIIDKKLWPEINSVLVGFGQVICKPKKPLCNNCSLINHCPYYRDNMLIEEKKLKKEPQKGNTT